MKKEIRYGGYSANRSDYDSEDGELAVSMGLVNEEGQLRHVLEPREKFKLASGCDVLFIHKTAAYTHYIATYVNPLAPTVVNLFWFDESYVVAGEIGYGTFFNIHTFDAGVKIYSANAVGNTLVVLADDGMHYALWKGDTTSYKYLGQKPPFLKMEFGTSDLHPEDYSDPGLLPTEFIASPLNLEESNVYVVTAHQVVFLKKHDEITQAAWALANLANAEITQEGHFYAPFYVRYCYKMYDGSSIMHSAPVFMPLAMPSTFRIVLANFGTDPTTGNITDLSNYSAVTPYPLYLYFGYRPSSVALMYKCAAAELQALTSDWADIIQSVDIFVSAPILREDNLRNIKTASQDDKPIYYCDNSVQMLDYPTVEINSVTYTQEIICDIPMLSEEAYMEKIRNVGNFFKVKSFSLDSITADSTFTPISIDGYILSSLAAQEVMVDDYKTHNRLLPSLAGDHCLSSMYNYNSRINLAAMTEQLFAGFDADNLVPCSDNTMKVVSIVVTLNTEEGTKRVVRSYPEGSYLEVSKLFLDRLPLFYPDNRAVKMDIYWWFEGDARESAGLRLWSLPMNQCALINGAITDGGLIKSTESQRRPTIPTGSIPTADDRVTMYNKLYTSEVDNPYYFPVTGINTIGTGQILAISTAAKALSQGQFGQFPLYAFTTDGVWALTVSDTGTYRAVQPVTRDVLIDADSVCQIDSAVLFATERGIMLISGSETQCISDILLADSQFDPATLPHLSEASTLTTHLSPFKNYLHGCRMVYDYLHQRIVLFNPTLNTQLSTPVYPYAYVFSLKSKLWGLTPTTLRTPLNSYPDALALAQTDTTTGKTPLVNLSDSLEGSDASHPVQEALLVTRPLKLGDPNILKTVTTMVQRGMFHKGNVKCLLYASRDLWNWQLIGSSTDEWMHNMRGTGYKWFRIALLATLPQGESISGATIEYELRGQNKLH